MRESLPLSYPVPAVFRCQAESLGLFAAKIKVERLFRYSCCLKAAVCHSKRLTPPTNHGGIKWRSVRRHQSSPCDEVLHLGTVVAQ
jgi:hypothetical protein